MPGGGKGIVKTGLLHVLSGGKKKSNRKREKGRRCRQRGIIHNVEFGWAQKRFLLLLKRTKVRRKMFLQWFTGKGGRGVGQKGSGSEEGVKGRIGV